MPCMVPVGTDDAELETEQTKGKVADPSGNVIEVKTYRNAASGVSRYAPGVVTLLARPKLHGPAWAYGVRRR